MPFEVACKIMSPMLEPQGSKQYVDMPSQV